VRGAWVPVVMGLSGALFLFYGSMLLVQKHDPRNYTKRKGQVLEN
jgi:hypothetical protein